MDGGSWQKLPTRVEGRVAKRRAERRVPTGVMAVMVQRGRRMSGRMLPTRVEWEERWKPKGGAERMVSEGVMAVMMERG